MNIASIKQYVKYAAPLAVVVLMAGTIVAAPFLKNQNTQAASGWATVASCTKEASASTNDMYFNDCLNNRSIEGMVFRAYRIVLNRNPDASGFKYWVNASATNVKNGKDPVLPIVKTLLYSQEARTKGVLTENTKLFVQNLYKRGFLRTADNAGLTYWVNQINRTDSKRKTYESVTSSFVQNNEAKKAWSLEAPCYITNYDARYCAD